MLAGDTTAHETLHTRGSIGTANAAWSDLPDRASGSVSISNKGRNAHGTFELIQKCIAAGWTRGVGQSSWVDEEWVSRDPTRVKRFVAFRRPRTIASSSNRVLCVEDSICCGRLRMD